jgi:hypothetical protein
MLRNLYSPAYVKAIMPHMQTIRGAYYLHAGNGSFVKKMKPKLIPSQSTDKEATQTE